MILAVYDNAVRKIDGAPRKTRSMPAIMLGLAFASLAFASPFVAAPIAYADGIERAKPRPKPKPRRVAPPPVYYVPEQRPTEQEVLPPAPVEPQEIGLKLSETLFLGGGGVGAGIDSGNYGVVAGGISTFGGSSFGGFSRFSGIGTTFISRSTSSRSFPGTSYHGRGGGSR